MLDGQNKKLRDHRNKSMSEGVSPDGGPAMHINVSNLGPYFSSSNFLIDMVTGYVFVLHKRRWIRTGLTCTKNQTPPEIRNENTRDKQHILEQNNRKEQNQHTEDQ